MAGQGRVRPGGPLVAVATFGGLRQSLALRGAQAFEVGNHGAQVLDERFALVLGKKAADLHFLALAANGDLGAILTV